MIVFSREGWIAKMLPTPSKWNRIKALFVQIKDAGSARRFARALTGSTADDVRRMIEAGSDFHPCFDREPGSTDDPRDKGDRWLFRQGMRISERFEIIKPLGRGGMGEIYEARDHIKDLPVALKIMLPNASIDPHLSDRMLRREFALAQMVTHPNVCRIFDPYRHEIEGTPMLVVSMELLRGPTLSSLLREKRRFDITFVIPIARQLAAGIDAAHSVGIIHRDLKPSNMILVEEHDGPRAVITDFGLARRLDQSTTLASNHVAGTLRYMAPEQIQGHTDKRSDLYTFAVVLFELLTGELPFSGDSDLSIALNRLACSPKDPAAIVPGIPIAWRVALLQALSRDPERRFQSAAALIHAIERPPIKPLLYRQILANRAKAIPVIFRLTAALILIAASLTSTLFFKPSHPPFQKFSHILVTELFHKPTEDSVLLGADASLAASIAQSPHLSVARTTELTGTLLKMGIRPDGPLDDETLRQLAIRSGESAILYGSISKGRGYVLHLRVEALSGDPKHAAATVQQDFQAATAAEVFGAVASAAAWIRQLSGEGLRDVNEQNARPEDLTTNSWDALKLLQEARARRAANDPSAALIFAKEALELDPGFAAAQAFLADAHTDLRQYKEAFEGYRRALDLARKRNVTGRERYQIEASYDIDAGDETALAATYGAWIAHFPEDYLPHFFLGFTRFQGGRYVDAVRELRRSEMLAPKQFAVLPHLAEAHLAKNEFQEAQRCVERLRELNENDWALEVEGLILLAQHQFEAAAAKVAPLCRRQDGIFPSVGPRYVASALADAGQLQRAEEALSQADNIGDGTLEARSADRDLQRAFLYWIQNDHVAARSALAKVGTRLDNPDSLSLAGALYARLGDLPSARRMLQKLGEWPNVPLVTRAAERVRAEIITARRTKFHKVGLPLPNLGEATPLDLEALLYAAVSGNDLKATEQLKQQIRNRKDILLSWDGRHAPFGLYWLATCAPICYPR